MTEREVFLIRLLAIGMGIVVLIVLSLIGYVAWKTYQQIQEEEKQS
ncbi:MAG: hypothetical protein Q6J68_03250 [Thermostichales cyanobacterium SZTDM-1c_bins_54]